jgi:hypothetical protein
MAMKEQQRTVHRSMQGKEVDMNKLANQNEMTVAVGNVKVNARGDELGPGGRIIKKREEVLREALPGSSVPDQANVRAKVEPEPARAPMLVSKSKNIRNMDPEGNE